MTGRQLSWGRYPNFPQRLEQVHWRSELPGLYGRMRDACGSTLPFGNGRSYGDSCLAVSDQVLSVRPLDRIIEADWANGVLAVEPGITLGELLSICIPKGWFLRVTPGTRFVTVGGAIANDVHGKNHHRRGTFGCHVSRFGLFRSTEGLLTCSAHENPKLYGATIGGLGLTGVVAWAEIHLEKIESSRIEYVTQRFGSLDEFFSLSHELDPLYEFSVAWVDCVAKGASTGRGVYTAGEFASDGDLSVSFHRKLSVPFSPPLSLVNRLSLRLFNEMYWHKHSRKRTERVGSFESFFYPLDSISNWNRVYGPQGFQQYQCVLPDDAGETGVRALLDTIAAAGDGSFLAVLKRFGEYPSPGLLSFPRSGVTLALDFRNRPPSTSKLFQRLDAIVREARGRLYPAKDAHMSAADFQSAYPQWQQLEVLRDPLLDSKFWRRVTR